MYVLSLYMYGQNYLDRCLAHIVQHQQWIIELLSAVCWASVENYRTMRIIASAIALTSSSVLYLPNEMRIVPLANLHRDSLP